MIYKSSILDVWIDDQFKFGNTTPIIYIQVQIKDEEYIKKNSNNGIVTLSMDAWNFNFPVGADIKSKMEDLANAFLAHKGKDINIDFNNVKCENGPSVFNQKDRRDFIASNDFSL